MRAFYIAVEVIVAVGLWSAMLYVFRPIEFYRMLKESGIQKRTRKRAKDRSSRNGQLIELDSKRRHKVS